MSGVESATDHDVIFHEERWGHEPDRTITGAVQVTPFSLLILAALV